MTERENPDQNALPGNNRKRGLSAIDPLELNMARPVGAAVAGGGIGGDEGVPAQVLQLQVDNLSGVMENAVSTELERAAFDRITEANAGIEQANRRREILGPFNERKARLVTSMQSILRPPMKVGAIIDKHTREPFAPCIDMLYTILEQHLTESFNDAAVFQRCFPTVQDQERGLMRDSFERLLKESMIRNINLNIVPRAITQILWNNDVLQMMVSASGSIVAIIFARDVLLLFANTVLSVMSFGNLNLEAFTNLCVWAYNNFTLENIQNLIVYFNVPPEAANQFIGGICSYVKEQRQYVIMTVYLLGLNAFNQGMGIDAINRYVEGLERRAAGVAPVDIRADNQPIALVNRQAAVAAVDAALAAVPAAAVPAAAVPAAVPAAAAAADDRPLNEILQAAGTDIVSTVRQIYLYGWTRGLRLTAGCLREVLTVHFRRPVAGQGFAHNIVKLAGTVSRWGVTVLRAESRRLDPDKPNVEVIRLMLTALGLNSRNITPEESELKIWEFTQNLKNNAITLLQSEDEQAGTCVYLTDDNLRILRHYFRHGRVQVDRKLMQSACLGMDLFCLSEETNINLIVEGGVRLNHDSMDVLMGSISSSRQRNESLFEREHDSVAKMHFTKLATLCRKAAAVQADAYTLIGVAIGAVEPGVDPQEIARRLNAARNISTKKQIMNSIESSIASDVELPPAQKQQIIADLRPIVASIDETGLREYLVEQEGVPETFIQNCQAVLNATVPAVIVGVSNVPTTIKKAVCAGFSRCAASLSNAAVYGNATVESAKGGLQCVRGLFGRIFGAAPDADAVVPQEQRAAAVVPQEQRADALAIISGNINVVDAAIDQGRQDRVAVDEGAGMSDSLPEVVNGPAAVGSAGGPAGSDMDSSKGGGRSRSRKRSASKRTRRKGKQPSKKLKRKSRRYVRRASSRKGRK